MPKVFARKNNRGYVYALSNPCFPYLKIGATKNNVDDRRRQLSKPSGVPMPFEIAHKVLVSDYMRAEKDIHTWLHDKHISKEFFNITVDDFIKAASDILNPVGPNEELEELKAAIQKLSFD